MLNPQYRVSDVRKKLVLNIDEQNKLPYLELTVPYPNLFFLRDNPRPRQVVRSEHSKDMVRGLIPKGNIPGVREVMKEIRDVQEDLKVEVEALLNGQKVAINTDAWTDLRIHTYVSAKLAFTTDEG